MPIRANLTSLFLITYFFIIICLFREFLFVYPILWGKIWKKSH